MHDDDLGQGLAVREWLASATGWTIVMGHHPVLSNGPHGNAGNYDGNAPGGQAELSGSRLASFFDQSVSGRADLYLAGHDHDLEAFQIPGGKAREVVIGGGGAAFYPLEGSNPPASVPRLRKRPRGPS
ncbi:MAG: hypothetical protein ACOYM2_12315 [Rectinemataceae bacterium]